MFRYTQDAPSGSDNLYLTENTYNGSNTGYHSLMVDPVCTETCWSNFNMCLLDVYITQILTSTIVLI
jgi:hypothetical protein